MKVFIYSLLFLCQFYLFLAGLPLGFKHPALDLSILTGKVQAVSTCIAEGIKQLGKKLDPMAIEPLNFDDDGFKLILTNRSMHGLKSMAVDNVSVDVALKVINVSFHTDFQASNVYTITGSLLSMPINGEGVYTIKLDDAHIDMVIAFDIVKNEFGKKVTDLKSYQYTYDVRKGVQFHFANLYNGDKDLSDKMHQALNQNWKLLVKRYGRYIFDKVNDKIFDSIRSYVFLLPLDTIV